MRESNIEARRREMEQRIEVFINQAVEYYRNQGVMLPRVGDCFDCHVSAQIGTQFGGVTHLLSHLDEGYVHGALIRNAFAHAGKTELQILSELTLDWNGVLIPEEPTSNAVALLRLHLRAYLRHHLLAARVLAKETL